MCICVQHGVEIVKRNMHGCLCIHYIPYNAIHCDLCVQSAIANCKSFLSIVCRPLRPLGLLVFVVVVVAIVMHVAHHHGLL